MRKALVLAAVLMTMGVAPAWAHVSVAPKEAPKGGTATFTFTVPNEEAPANTTSVEIMFPNGVTFRTVTPEAKPGWTATPGASSVQWSGGTITGENKETFTVTLGPLPNDETVLFKAIQRYDNGTVVRWIDEQTGSEEPEHPAPSVRLTGAAVATTSTTVTAAAPTTLAAPTEEDDGGGAGATPIVFGALVLAGVGAGIAIAARRRTPQP